MATFTEFLNLRKPDTTDAVNVETDLSDNWDIVDAAVSAATFANIVTYGADATGVSSSTTAIEDAVATGLPVFVPLGKFLCSVTLTAVDGLRITGPGVLHNTTASQDALTLIDCDDAHVDVRVQGTAGTRNGLRLENCPRAYLGPNTKCYGSGEEGIYAERCLGIMLDHCTVSRNSPGPYPTGVPAPVHGLKLTWDGADVTSGCNGFTIDGGEYVIGLTQQEAIWLERCEGGTVIQPIVSQSGGGIYTQFCENLVFDGMYGEENPRDVEYNTGTVTVTNGSPTVSGTGTTFSASGVLAGQYLRVGGHWQRIETVGSDTQLTLRDNWSATGAAGTAYSIMSSSLVLDGSTDCLVGEIRCGDAIALGGSRNKLGFPKCESVWMAAATAYNTGDVITNRASAAGPGGQVQALGNRIQNWGDGTNQVRQLSYDTGLDVPQWHVVGTGSGEPAFANSWVNFGGSQITAAFIRLPDGMVLLRGQVKSGTIGAAVFTLPAGYRPSAIVGPFAVHSNAAFGECEVLSTGEVVALTGNNTSFNLDGVCFLGEQ